MNPTLLIAFLALTVVFPSILRAQLPPDAVAAATERLEGKSGSGMIIGAIHGMDVKYYHFNGSASNANVIEPTTIVEIGSISKVFTALLAAQRITEGTMKLREPIASYLPSGTSVPEYQGKAISVMDVLSHSSGLPRLPANMKPADMTNPYKEYTSSDAYNFLKNYALTRSPGEKYEYSNFGFALMGLALAHTSGKPYSALVDEQICKPLKMQSTWLNVPIPMRSRMAAPYLEGNKASYWDLGAFEAAGGMKSTPEDMARFVQACMGKTERPLADANDLASAGMFPTDIPFTSIGLGWHVTEAPGGSVVWHNGGTGGFRSFIGYDREQDKGVVVFVNNAAIDPTDIGMHILNPGQKVERYPEKLVVTHEMLAPYAGEYELFSGFSITVTVKDAQIFAQATGQERFEIYPKSPTHFYYRVTVASVDFDVQNGVVKGLTLNQNNQELYGKKIK